jgi:uncharacterized protein (DUF1697 family)
MPTFIALLRGINVGGHASVAMANLRDLAESMGMTQPRTLLQSGNLVFTSSLTAAAIETLFEKKAQERFGFPISFLVRSAQEWSALVTANPFADEAKRDPGHFVVMCLKHVPAAESLSSLKKAIRGPEYFECHKRELYLVYPDGMGRTKLTGALIEKTLATRGTARNWNTVQKIAVLLANDSA